MMAIMAKMILVTIRRAMNMMMVFVIKICKRMDLIIVVVQSAVAVQSLCLYLDIGLMALSIHLAIG